MKTVRTQFQILYKHTDVLKTYTLACKVLLVTALVTFSGCKKYLQYIEIFCHNDGLKVGHVNNNYPSYNKITP